MNMFHQLPDVQSERQSLRFSHVGTVRPEVVTSHYRKASNDMQRGSRWMGLVSISKPQTPIKIEEVSSHVGTS